MPKNLGIIIPDTVYMFVIFQNVQDIIHTS